MQQLIYLYVQPVEVLLNLARGCKLLNRRRKLNTEHHAVPEK